MAMSEIEDEIARTCAGLETTLTDDGRYVRISDGQCSWWQPVAKLLPIVRRLPNWDAAVAGETVAPRISRYDGQMIEQEPGEAEARAYAEWCRATAPAGFFGHNAATDTMPVPAGFGGELPGD
jgi:hypothetical protein